MHKTAIKEQSTKIKLQGFAVLVPLFCFLISGCGFHPTYGGVSANGTPVADELGKVAIDPIPDHAGQMLRNYLIDRLNSSGRPATPEYHLVIKLRVVDEDLGTLANGTTTLAAVHSYGDYTLTDAKGKKLTDGKVNSSGQYDKLANMYGTQAAHDSAIDRTVRELSEQLASRVGLYFAEYAPTTP